MTVDLKLYQCDSCFLSYIWIKKVSHKAHSKVSFKGLVLVWSATGGETYGRPRQ